ncbi:NADPH-dependent FMN reductase [Nocardioides yefusunii]|uniref:NADPH-dependent FMN reductase n=1 Tax=Nocardioides yefusunii TaxID=2500546 RepID=A0ABW1R2D5_9ACTN|nr:NADPH-dependent FMN reductase [Nocardioides yefusunii]
MTVKIGYIIGSLSSTSMNRAAFEAVKKNAPAGVEFSEIAISELPFYSQDAEVEFPAVAQGFKDAIEASDALVVVTPTFNNSLPGALKNALDWSSRPWGNNSFAGKPVAVASASPSGHAGAPAANHVADVLGFGEAKVLETQFNLTVSESTFTAEGDFAEDETKARAAEFVAAIAANAQV